MSAAAVNASEKVAGVESPERPQNAQLLRAFASKKQIANALRAESSRWRSV